MDAGLALKQRDRQVHLELGSQIATDPGMHPALTIQKTLTVRYRENAIVPDARMDI